jgi:hypothetical protein
MKKLSQYLFEFIAIFTAITISFLVDEWREARQNREETVKALQIIKFDLQIDTSYFNARLSLLNRYSDYLRKGVYDEIETNDVKAFRQLLVGLRGNVDYQVKTQGIRYLRNNIRLPLLKNDTLLTEVGFYHDLTGDGGNYKIITEEHLSISGANFQDLYSFNPHFSHEDSTIANRTMRRNMAVFLNDPYWQGRINLSYRLNSRTMRSVYEKQLRYAEHILEKIELELDPEIAEYTILQTNK